MNNLWGGSVRGTTHRYRKCYKWVTVCAEEENRSIFRASIWHRVQQGLWSMGELETWLICSITTLILTLKLLQVIFFGPFSVGFRHFIFISIDKYFGKSLSLVNLSVKATSCNFYFKASRTKLILHVCQSGRETRGSSYESSPAIRYMQNQSSPTVFLLFCLWSITLDTWHLKSVSRTILS